MIVAVAIVGAILIVGVVGGAVARGPAGVEEGHGSIDGLWCVACDGRWWLVWVGLVAHGPFGDLEMPVD